MTQTPTFRQTRRIKSAAKLESLGYRGVNARPACARCDHCSLKPYTNGKNGKVFHCGKHRAYVAAYGVCPDYSGLSAFQINPKGLEPCFLATAPIQIPAMTNPKSAPDATAPEKATGTEPPV